MRLDLNFSISCSLLDPQVQGKHVPNRGSTEPEGYGIREMLFVDEASLTAHTEDALQLLISCFAHACKEFGSTVILKKTNILGQDVSSMPSISIGDCTLEVVENFI